MTQAPTGRPPERYGEDRPQWHRTLARVLTAALALVALGWVVWAGLGLAQRDVRWQDVGFDVQDATTVDVTFEVTVYADEGAARVTCTIEALSSRYVVVGRVDVPVEGTGGGTVRRTASVLTQEQATTAGVKECRTR